MQLGGGVVGALGCAWRWNSERIRVFMYSPIVSFCILISPYDMLNGIPSLTATLYLIYLFGAFRSLLLSVHWLTLSRILLSLLGSLLVSLLGAILRRYWVLFGRRLTSTRLLTPK